MKASKFTEAQIAFVLKQAADGTPVAEVCRKAGISDATFYNWRKRYAGLMPSEMRRLRQLEDEPPPVCRRLQLLRRWSHDGQDDEQVLLRGARAGGAAGAGSRA
ncbi:transposase [Xanthobacter variabilis]|uniref:transposase n=1 Tax=Xanthobacter variabilis TaxID=3119932 RepID=UPI00372747BA